MGFALRVPADAARFTAPRLGLVVVPSLLGWAALMLPPVIGLVALALGILATAAVETLAARHGLVPGYLRLRWMLSMGATLCLMAGAVAAHQ